MPIPWEAAAGQGGSLVGGILGGIGSYMGVVSANQAAQENLDRQLRFQRKMSNTAYQRAMRDMRAAGLNPMLAYQRGGATSPAGVMFAPQSELGAAVTSAREAARAASEIALRKESAKLAKQQAQTSRGQMYHFYQAGDKAAHEATSAKAAATLAVEEAALRMEVLRTPAGRRLYQAGVIGRMVNPLVRPITALRRP